MKLFKRPSPAIVVALIALVLAMSGTGYALTLPKNSIGKRQLKTNAVTSAKIKNGTIVGKDINSRTRRALKGHKGAPGRNGQAGPRGPAGAAGAAGKVGVSGYQVIQVKSASDSTSFKSLYPECPAGKVLLGGGAQVSGSVGGVGIVQSGPDTGATESKWEASAQEIAPQASNWTLYATIYCAQVAP
jgi:hypothetical protein